MADPSKKVPDLNCQVQGQDLLLEAVDLKQEVPDLRSSGIPGPNLTPGCWLNAHNAVNTYDASLRYDTIRYDTRCYFNVRSKADISQLNLPHGTDN